MIEILDDTQEEGISPAELLPKVNAEIERILDLKKGIIPA